MFSWITKGKKIENYIPKEALELMFARTIKKACGQYELLPKYIEKIYANFTHNKVQFANRFKEHITTEKQTF